LDKFRQARFESSEDNVIMNAAKNFAQVPQPGKADGGSHDLEKIIAEHPFLKGLSPHQFRILTDCAMFTRFESGELLLREGDPANRFYLILRGKVSVESYAPDLGVTPIQTVAGGDVLGWSWLFPPYYWHFNARAVELTEAVFFYSTPLRDECETDHDLGYELVKRMAEVMMKRLQATRRQLLNWSPNQ
jgi:CRP/FNR family transcriptional regulator, cyclic AMP receptor protein